MRPDTLVSGADLLAAFWFVLMVFVTAYFWGGPRR